MPIATLIANERLASGQLAMAQDCLNEASIECVDTAWIEAGHVVDIHFKGGIENAKLALQPLTDELDYIVQADEGRQKKLLISDMDSTMITVECIDELADYAGIKTQIAQVTERAMRGEIDFEEALRARVGLLKGLHQKNIDICLRERITMTAGAKTLVQTMAARGAVCVLVSGGFTQFAKNISDTLGFHAYHANELEIIDDHMTGDIKGDIVDAQYKKTILNNLMIQNGLKVHNIMAVGDGANDIPMIEAAGIGVSYHGKAALEDISDMVVRHGDLTTLLLAQGIAKSEWVK